MLGGELRHRGGTDDTGEALTGVDREDLGGAVLTERRGDGRGVGTDVHALDGAELARLGEQLERCGGGLVALGLCVDPDLHDVSLR